MAGLAGAEGVYQGGQRAHQAHREAGDGREVVQAVLVEEHLGVSLREHVAAGGAVRPAVFYRQDAHDRLLLKPLARVALVGAGAPGKLGGRSRASFGQGSVQTETVA